VVLVHARVVERVDELAAGRSGRGPAASDNPAASDHRDHRHERNEDGQQLTSIGPIAARSSSLTHHHVIQFDVTPYTVGGERG
jgi:hypothetical protein